MLIKLFFANLQKIGKSLMLPVSVLPIAGILLGVGASKLGFIPTGLSTILEFSGGAIFSNLALIFAIGVALGFTNNDGVCALAAVVGYYVMLSALGSFALFLDIPTKTIHGVSSIETGVVGGILIGMVAAWVFNRFYKITLPTYLGFFSGKRSVPIITSFAAIVLAGLLALVWPPIGRAIGSFSVWAAHESPEIAFSLYGLVERSLIPFGLHHIWNVPFFFETGSYVDVNSGKTVMGEIARYLSGDPTAGNLAGGYLFKMWGLPGAALAIWMSARVENRKKIGGIMISAALTSFLTGITEPIEFAFLFVAPLLYALHAILASASFYLCIVLGIKHGTTFSHGLIDYILLFPQSTNAGWLFVLGPLSFVLYFLIFKFAISYFNLKTPGRELEVENDDTTESQTTLGSSTNNDFNMKLLKALGGAANILILDACITRLRIQLKDIKLCNKDEILALGASAAMIIGDGVQIIFGTKSDSIRQELTDYIKKGANTKQSPKIQDLESIFGGSANISQKQQCGPNRIRIEVKNESMINVASAKKQFGECLIKISDNVYHVLV